MSNIIQIPLDKGLFALIDSNDEEIVKKHKWYGRKGKWATYATSSADKRLHMHRLIMGVTDPKLHVDHKNHNGLDNRRDNLRIVNQSMNMCNKRAHIGKSSKYKGVYWNKEKSRWTCQIKPPNQKTIHVGHFKSEIEAAIAYNQKAMVLHGEYACLNVISSQLEAKIS